MSPYGTPEASYVEKYRKFYWYSNDHLHLPIESWEENGQGFAYRYVHGTDLLEAKFTKDNGNIILREFFAYDNRGILIEKVIDNGTDANKDILTGVTERFITTIVPVQNGYGIGLPETITESYLDRTAKEPLLLKRKKLSYNKAGQVTAEQLFDAENKHCYTLETKYNDKGRVKWRKNELGHEFEYGYDANCNKTYEKQHGVGHYTVYEYDKANRLIAEIQHHDDGTVIRTTCEYDLMGNKTSSSDRYGNITNYQYDQCNRLQKITLPTNETIAKEYDIFDNVVAVTDQNGSTTKYEYTARKQPCKILYPHGSQERFQYNLNGTLAHKWDQNGTKTSYQYDVLGRVTETSIHDPKDVLLSKVTNRYNAFHLLSTTDAMGYTTSYSYDVAGRKVEEYKEHNGAFTKTSFHYDSLGRLSCTKRYFGKGIHDFIATEQEYDLVNRITLERKVDARGVILSWQRYQYDRAGNRTATCSSHLEGVDAEIKTDFNSQAEPVQVTDALGHVTLHHMDHSMRQHTTQDALGAITEEHFDALGRVVAVLKRSVQGTLLAQTNFTYNGTGKKTKQTEHVFIDGIKSHEYVLAWAYDELDRVTQLTEPDGKITNYTYDASGRIKTIAKPDGVLLVHEYDALGRLTELKSSDDTVHYTYTYDLHNNPIEVHDRVEQLVICRTYDAWGRVLSETVNGVFKQTFTYDSLGRIVALTAPDNSAVTYEYLDGYLRKIKRGSFEHSYNSFDLQGRVLQAGNLQFSWDKKGRNTQISSPQYSLAIPEDGFDAVGNLKTMTFIDAIGQVNCAASYDDLYQLVEESGVQAHSYKNDSLFNRHKKDDAQCSLDHTNMLISDTFSSFEYDKNGNLIEQKSPEGVISYTYDALDRLVTVTKGSKTTRYIYDSFHRRIARVTEDGKKQYFVYLDCREIGLFDAEEKKLNEFRVLGLGKGAELGATVLIELEGRQFTSIHDNRGNIVCLLDVASGTTQETYRYTAFGECEVYDGSGNRIAQSHLHNPWGFSSKRLDPETGFYYFHRRYYAPNHGRWITPDPIGFSDGPNLYAYVHNNPMTRFDLYGLFAYEDESDPLIAAELYGVLDYGLRIILDTTSFIGYQVQEKIDIIGHNALNACREAYLDQLTTFPGNTASVNELRASTEGGLKMTQALDFGRGILNIFRQSVRGLSKVVDSGSKTVISSSVLEHGIGATAKTGKNQGSKINAGQHLRPHPEAQGPHSSFKRDPKTGDITKYETYTCNANPQDPRPWAIEKKYHGIGDAKGHYNKELAKRIPHPHVHDDKSLGGVREAMSFEIPKKNQYD